MLTQTRQVTLEEYRDFVNLPENAEKLFELIDGEVVEVVPGRTRNSEIGHIITFAARLFCRDHGLPCHTSGGDGAYQILGNALAPDFAYKRTPTSDEYADPDPPLWAVEIISPTDKAAEIRKKRQVYIDAGILYWEMYPQAQSIDVYAPGQPQRVVGSDGTLDGGDVLPGFTLAARELFGG